MSWRAKVVWSSGMFLQPHHFQQETRYLERLVDARARSLSPFSWGFDELEIDEGLLALGKLGIARASGVLPDGTPFSMPQLDALPVPMDVPVDMKDELAVLALPLQREGLNEVDFGTTDRHDQLGELARYDAAEEQARDNTDSFDEPATIQTGRLRLKLMRRKDATDAHTVLGVARVRERRHDGQVSLDRQYIAPQVAIAATSQLSASASLLHGLVAQRAQALADRMGQLSHGISEMAEFLMLQTLNRNEPVFAQHAATPHAHPRELHRDCLRLAGDLATLSSAQRRPPVFPPYRHDDLTASFAPVLDALRSMLTAMIDPKAVPIELAERGHGVRTATVGDLELMRSAGLVLAVHAQMPGEKLRTQFASQTKLGPVDRIRDLVNLQLPGVTLRALAVAPRQLPFHAGFHYFELERHGELWKAIEQSGNLAMHTAGDFPGLELELWAIRP